MVSRGPESAKGPLDQIEKALCSQARGPNSVCVSSFPAFPPTPFLDKRLALFVWVKPLLRQAKPNMKLSQSAAAAAAFASALACATPSSALPNSAGGCVSPPPSHSFATTLLQLLPPTCPADILDQCAALSKAGLGNVLTPGSAAYEARTKTYWSITSQLTPWCIVSPPSTTTMHMHAVLTIRAQIGPTDDA